MVGVETSKEKFQAGESHVEILNDGRNLLLCRLQDTWNFI